MAGECHSAENRSPKCHGTTLTVVGRLDCTESVAAILMSK